MMLFLATLVALHLTSFFLDVKNNVIIDKGFFNMKLWWERLQEKTLSRHNLNLPALSICANIHWLKIQGKGLKAPFKVRKYLWSGWLLSDRPSKYIPPLSPLLCQYLITHPCQFTFISWKYWEWVKSFIWNGEKIFMMGLTTLWQTVPNFSTTQTSWSQFASKFIAKLKDWVHIWNCENVGFYAHLYLYKTPSPSWGCQYLAWLG